MTDDMYLQFLRRSRPKLRVGDIFRMRLPAWGLVSYRWIDRRVLEAIGGSTS